MADRPPTATTEGARAHARAMSGTVVDAMPTVPARAAAARVPGVPPDDLLWHEVVAGGGYTSASLPRGTRVRLTDPHGDACAGLLLHRRDAPAERLNVADTVKVQWQAYLGVGQLLLSDMGRALATVVEDSSGGHDAFCGTSWRAGNEARYGDGAPDGPSPNGRDHFAVALAKHGLGRRDVAPNINLFKRVRVEPDGSLRFDGASRPGAAVVLRLELACIVTIVNVPHPLDDRLEYTVTPLQVAAWRGEPAAADDPARTVTPEAERKRTLRSKSHDVEHTVVGLRVR
ncbi:MAG: urea amidolyase associated protein UAAP1, partial [Acidimicrobiales bacterium]